MITDKTIKVLEQQIKQNFENIKEINEFCRQTCNDKGHVFSIVRNKTGSLSQKCKNCNFSQLILKTT